MRAMRNVGLSVALLFVLIAVLQILKNDRSLSQGVDEACHVAAGMEWLVRHTYTLDPVHPLLARYAIALPLYLVGARYPQFTSDDPRGKNFNDVGNAILGDRGHYERNLFLARIGILPFFCLAAVVVYVWTNKYFGTLAACVAVGLFTTTPSILAFAGLAYNDLPVAAMQLTFLYLLTVWLEQPTWRRTIVLGLIGGLAIATKFTSLVFLGASTVAVLVYKLWSEGKTGAPDSRGRRSLVRKLLAAAAISVVALWGTYGFSTGRVQEAMQLSPSAMPTFQHYPAPIRKIAHAAVLSDPRIPAPELIHGFALLWERSSPGPSCYLFGKIREGGWWFFFPVALALKTPIALLLLALIGAIVAVVASRQGKWIPLVPVISLAAILGIAMLGKYNVGTRYVLVVFGLFSILGGLAAQWLAAHYAVWGKVILSGLLLWQLVANVAARHDFLAYFNEFAPADPSKVLVYGCDFDCGEDLFRLRDALLARKVSHFSLALWSTADLSQLGLPPFEVLKPFEPASGWIAVSARSRRAGDVLHQEFPLGSLSWIEKYQPVAHVGQTILLYYIPEQSASPSLSQGTKGEQSSAFPARWR